MNPRTRPPRSGIRRHVALWRQEQGFSLVEALASLLVLALVMSAMAAGTIAAYRAVRQTKFLQQATALGNEAVERARDLSFDDLVMDTSDLSGDARVLGTCSGLTGTAFFKPASNLNCEKIVHAVGGPVDPHITTETVEGKQYTVSRYITWVDRTSQGGAGEHYKRLAVIVEWDDTGVSRSYTTSTFITSARRGLPVPKFQISPTGAQTKNAEAGGTSTFSHSITNLGVVDAYDVTMTLPAGWTVAMYRDAGEIGVYEAGVDIALSDTNGTGAVDTGNVPTSGSATILAVVTVPVGTPTGVTALTLSVASGIDPGRVEQASDRVNVVVSAGLRLYFHNDATLPLGAPTADTTALANMYASTTAPTGATQYRYSTDLHNADQGRFVGSGGNATSSAVSQMANWLYQNPASRLYQGTAEVTLWVASTGFQCDKTVRLQVHIRGKTTRTDTVAAYTASSAIVAVPGPGGLSPCGFQQVSVPVTVNRTVPANNWIEVKVVVDASSDAAALLAYDTASFSSSVRLPTP